MKLVDFPMIIVCIVLIYTPVGCISIFEPVGVQPRAGILVVEGMIMETGTTVQLSKTVQTGEKLTVINYEDLNRAIIHVIDESNNVIAVAERQIEDGVATPGAYIVNNSFSFKPGMKYALDLQVEGKHYRSAYLSPVHTPAIDEISWQLNDDRSIDIFVSTHDPENKTNYYRWSFEEDWEIRSNLFTYYRYDPETDEVISIDLNKDSRYYCWASDHSKSLLIASSVKYTDVGIKNHKIHSFQPGNSRYSYLYSILVRQYGLEEEAWMYFDNLQRNMDESSSIFAPQPSEKTGNIQCLSDPDETVIGYITASEVATYRLYIPMAELQLNNLEDQYNCSELEDEDLLREIRAKGPAYAFLFINLGIINVNPYDFRSIECLDCTRRGGIKTKPDFWPNDHQ